LYLKLAHQAAAERRSNLARRFNAGNRATNMPGVASATPEWPRRKSGVADATRSPVTLLPGVETPG